jgi:KipI family sensor histidine kinase inhibitor
VDDGWTLLPYGPHDLLVELSDPQDVTVAAGALRTVPGVEIVVPAERTVLVRMGERRVDHAALEQALRGARRDPSRDHSTAQVIEIEVVYDGEDLDEVASRTGLSVAEVVERHTSGEYLTAFCGFTPGFGYLTGLDPILELPRRASPRSSVPAGSVAIAAHYTSVYPCATPGGWHLLGHTRAVMWDLGRARPSLVEPGDRVRFVAVGGWRR